MKQILILIVIITATFCCNAQINLEDSPFANITIVSLRPSQPLSKKELKQAKRIQNTIPTENIIHPYFIDFELKIDFVRLKDGQIATFFTMEIENQELAFLSVNKIPTATLALFGRITAIDKKTNGIFEEVCNYPVSENDLTKLGGHKDKQKYIRGVMLSSGKYRIMMAVRDEITGKTGIRRVNFTVPEFQN